jgi:hypothetical protein
VLSLLCRTVHALSSFFGRTTQGLLVFAFRLFFLLSFFGLAAQNLLFRLLSLLFFLAKSGDKLLAITLKQLTLLRC